MMSCLKMLGFMAGEIRPVKISILLILILSPTGNVEAQLGTIEDRSASPLSAQYVTEVIPGEFDHYRIHIHVRHMKEETSRFLLPRWAPGFYRIMGWHENIGDVQVAGENGSLLAVERTGDNSWIVANGLVQDFTFSYSVEAPVSIRDGVPSAMTRHYLHDLGGLISGPRSWMYLEGYTSRWSIVVNAEVSC